ncbi:MAG: amidohydrolase [Deltaproteobacteria bacterium]|nr:MAG: amidohydrolase [Deltaproteobacteria bacterium]
MRTLPLLLLGCATPSPPTHPPDPPPGIWIQGEAWLGSPLPSPQQAVIHLHQGQLRVVSEPPEGVEPRKVDRITAAFVDAHAHPAGLGRKIDDLDLQGLPTFSKTLQAVADRVASTEDGWILGRGWDQNEWPDAPQGAWPTAAHLDPITGERPTVLRRVDGHAAWVNQAALRAAGITRDTPDPKGGRILRDPSGAPTGVLIDTAASLVPVPEPSVDQVIGWLRTAQETMLGLGLAGAHDMGVDDTTLSAYRALNAQGQLRVRIDAYLSPSSQAAEVLLREGPLDEGRLSIVGIKAYADGALGSRGAHLLEPYADEPQTRGLAITSREALADLAIRCLRVRAQLAVHAIGDAAARDVIDAFEAARRAVPEASAVPLRLEHAQVVAASDRARLGPLNIIASVQPTHATSDHAWAVARLGPSRVEDSYAWRALDKAGARLVLGSDFPVESPDPALGILAATQRVNAEGRPEGGWRPDQALTEAEAIAGFTFWAGEIVGENPQRCIGQEGCGSEITVWVDGRGEVVRAP